MTAEEKTPENMTSEPYLSFSPDDLVAVRVRPAQLAKIFSVSRQAVSTWVKRGFITLGADGRADLREATDQMMRNTSTQHLRARAFRSASAKLWQLEQENKALRRRVGELENERDYYRDEFATSVCWSDRFLARVTEAGATLRALDDVEFTEAVEDMFFQAGSECNGEPLPTEWLYENQPPGAPLAQEGEGVGDR